MPSSYKTFSLRLLAILFVFLVWKLLSLYFQSELVLPSPEKTLQNLWQILIQSNAWKNIGFTVFRGLIALSISMFFAIILGTLSGKYFGIKIMVHPWIVILRSLPVISIILLALIWFEIDNIPIFTGTLTMFPILYVQITDGLASLSPEYVEMSNVYKVSNYKKLKYLYIPTVLPHLFTGLSHAMGIGWKAIVMGEVLSLPDIAIGTRMQNAQVYLQVNELIAWTIIAILISFIFESIIRWLKHVFVVQ